MPTYINKSRRVIEVNGRPVRTGETVSSLVWHNHILGLELVDDKPLANSILVSQKCEGECEVAIPTKDAFGKLVSRYLIHLYVERGCPTVYFSSDKNEPALNLYTGAKWNVRCYERLVEKVIVRGKGQFIVWVLCEII